MAFCSQCGRQVVDSTTCSICGGAVAKKSEILKSSVADESYYSGMGQIVSGNPPGVILSKSGQSHTPEIMPQNINFGILIWSMITTLFLCSPLGAVALLMLYQAKGKSPQDMQTKTTMAIVFNILGILGAVLTVLFSLFTASAGGGT